MKKKEYNNDFQILCVFAVNNIFVYVLIYIQNVLINKYMLPGDLGLFSYNQTILNLMVGVYSLEAYSAYLRFVGYYSYQDIVRKVRVILLVASVLFVATSVVVWKSFAYLLFFFFIWYRERMYFFRATSRIKKYGLVKIIQGLLLLLMLFILIHFNLLNHKSLILCYGLSYLITTLIFCRDGVNSNDIVLEPTIPLDNRKILRYIIPLGFSAIVVWLLGAADQLLINQFLGPVDLTNYSVAFRLLGIVRLGTGIIMEYWPRFYIEKIETRDLSSLKKMRFLFVVVVILISLGSAIFSKMFYFILGASAYSSSRLLYSVLSIGEAFRILASILMTFQSYKNNTSISIGCLGAIGILKFAINLFFIQHTGVWFLVVSTVVGYFIYFICAIFFGWLPERKFWKDGVNL